MGSVMTQIVDLLTSGITGIASGIGQGLQALVQNVFLTEATGGGFELSTFGTVTIIFAGVSLAIGLSTLIFNWVTGLGK